MVSDGVRPEPSEILRVLRQRVPELEGEERWPLTIVFDAFADHVADRVRAGADVRALDPYFRFVEELAASGDRRLEDLVVVCFCEAAPWRELGVGALLGPATTELAAERRTGRTSQATTTEGTIHTRLVDRFPEVGELCFDDVLSEVAQLAWEAHVDGRSDVVRRAMTFAEWLAEHGRRDLATRTVSPLLDANAAEQAGPGSRTSAMPRGG